jgi:hypothetical protein
MWVENEHCSANDAVWTALDASNARVTVFDRRWKLAFLERRAHARALALRYTSREHERLRPTADSTEERLHHDVILRGVTQYLVAYLSPAGRDYPERSRVIAHATNILMLYRRYNEIVRRGQTP